MSKAGCLVLVFKLPCTKRYLRYCSLTSFQQMASEWPRTTLIPWRAQGGTLGERLGIAAITIVFGIGTKTGANRAELARLRYLTCPYSLLLFRRYVRSSIISAHLYS